MNVIDPFIGGVLLTGHQGTAGIGRETDSIDSIYRASAGSLGCPSNEFVHSPGKADPVPLLAFPGELNADVAASHLFEVVNREQALQPQGFSQGDEK